MPTEPDLDAIRARFETTGFLRAADVNAILAHVDRLEASLAFWRDEDPHPSQVDADA